MDNPNTWEAGNKIRFPILIAGALMALLPLIGWLAWPSAKPPAKVGQPVQVSRTSAVGVSVQTTTTSQDRSVIVLDKGGTVSFAPLTSRPPQQVEGPRKDSVNQ